MNYQGVLKKQVVIVIRLLEKNYSPLEEDGVIKLIYKRYLNAKNILDNEIFKIEDLHLLGGVRAYMDSYSDYENPLLEEMGKAEEILEQMKIDKKSNN